MVCASQPVIDPCPERRATCELCPRIHLADAARVVDAVGPDRSQNGQFIRVSRDIGDPVGEPLAAFPVLLPFSLVGQHGRVEFAHRGDDAIVAVGQRFARKFFQSRFGVG